MKNPQRTVQLLLLTLLVTGSVVGHIACASGGGGAARTSASLDDATISTRVKTALLNEPNLGALRIDVAAESGVVTLSGAVNTAEEADKALALARTVQGVRDVRSTLQVQAAAPPK